MKVSYKITDQARIRFKKYLAGQEISITEFAKRCGVNRVYISKVINGKFSITPRVIEIFKTGGYDLI